MSIVIHTVENGFTIHATVHADGKTTQKTYVARNQGELVKHVKALTKVKRVPKPKKEKTDEAAK